MLGIYIAADDRYLDVSPTVLLTSMTVLVGLLVSCLIAEKAVEWFRSHR